MNLLLDEHSVPPLRRVIEQLLLSAERAEIAVSNIRLAMIDLGSDELDAIGECRILVRSVEARTLSTLSAGNRAQNEEHRSALRQFVRSDRVEIRSAGMGSWAPDFSIFRNLHGSTGARDVCLIGAHYFHVPVALNGPSLTCVLTSRHAIVTALARFEALWDSAHDIRHAVVAALEPAP